MEGPRMWTTADYAPAIPHHVDDLGNPPYRAIGLRRTACPHARCDQNYVDSIFTAGRLVLAFHMGLN